MAGPNTYPIYTVAPNTSSDGTSTSSSAMAPTFTTAAADYTGATATHNKLVFTAGTNGGYVRKLRFKAIGTNTQSVARVFINNGGANTTAANNSFVSEITLPATTASNTIATPDVDLVLEMAIDPSFRLYVGLATTVAAGWVCVPFAGKY